jgi:hypothetical protein
LKGQPRHVDQLYILRPSIASRSQVS